jgi:hypothetical protein
MEVWSLEVASVLAPELRWQAETVAREDRLDEGQWETTRRVRLVGRGRDGVERGRGEVRLEAGGTLTQVGGHGLIELEAVRPVRYLVADNHCDVTHWDVLASPVDEAGAEALVRSLERVLGRELERGGERRDPVARVAQLLGSADTEEAALWMEDLDAASIAARGQAMPDGRIAVLLEDTDLDDVFDLEEARITLGELLSEAGHDDWQERARALLARLPSSPS